MPDRQHGVLIYAQEASVRVRVRELLAEAPASVRVAEATDGAVSAAVSSVDADVCLLALGAGASPIGPLVEIAQAEPDLPIVILSTEEQPGAESAAAAAGALDWLLLGELTPRSLRRAIRYAAAAGTARRRARQRTRRLVAMQRVSQIALSDDDLTTSLQRATEVIAQATGFPFAAVALHDAVAGELDFVGRVGLPLPAGEALRVPDTQSLSGLAARTGRVVVERDVGARSEVKHPVLRGVDARTLVSVPIRLEGQVLGVLTLADPRARSTGRSFVRWARGIAGGIALLIDHKRSEQLLVDREARYRALTENAADAVTIVDAETRIAYVSPATERVLGHHAGELIGSSILDVLHPDDRVDSRERFQQVLDDPGHEARWSVRVRHRDGGYRTLDATARNMLDAPAVRGIVVNAQDVTGARELEAQLLQAQKMDAIGRLAGGVAHDFNNLLTAITGHTHMLLEDLPPLNPMRQDLEEILSAADRAAALTRQLLAFSRKQVLQPRVIDLNTAVGDLEKMLRRLIPEDIELRTVLGHDVPQVRVDATQLDQVIVNLAVNAREAMPSGGRLVVETRRSELDEEYAGLHEGVAPGSHALLTVSDTGVGMGPETLAHIFEPFFTTKEKGTGLGLATVYGIVKQSGGHIWVYSEPEKGTTFKLYLPAVTGGGGEAVAHRKEAVQPHALSGSETILLIEDDETIRRLVLKSLGKQGYRIIQASDGEEALRISRTFDGAIHLVVTDMVLPGINGLEVVDALRCTRPKTRYIVTSGYTEVEVAEHGLPAGGTFLEKPFTPETLARRVRVVLDSPAP